MSINFLTFLKKDTYIVNLNENKIGVIHYPLEQPTVPPGSDLKSSDRRMDNREPA